MATNNDQNQQNPNQNNKKTPFGTPMDLIMATLMRGIDKDGDRIEELLKQIRDELSSDSRKDGNRFRRATDDEMWKSKQFKDYSRSAYTLDEEGMPKSAGQEFVDGLKAPFQMVMRHLRLGKYSAGHVRKKINDFRRDEETKIEELQRVADSQENIEIDVPPVDDFAEKMASFDADQANVRSWRDGGRTDGLNDFHLAEMVKSLKEISERVTSIDTSLKETFKPKRDLGARENAGIDAAAIAERTGQESVGQVRTGINDFRFDEKSKTDENEIVKSKVDENEIVKSKVDENEIVKSKTDENEIVKSKVDENEIVKSKVDENEIVKSKVDENEIVKSKVDEMQRVADPLENIENDVLPANDFVEKMAASAANQSNVRSWRGEGRSSGLKEFHSVEMVKSLKEISERVTSIDLFLKETFKPKRDLGTGENSGIDAAAIAERTGQATGQDSGGVFGGGFDFRRDGKPTGSTKPTGKPAAGKGVTGRIVDAAKKTATTAAKVGKVVGRSVPFLTGAAVLGESVLDHMSIDRQVESGAITLEQATEQKFDSKAGAVGGLVGTGVGAALGAMTGPFAPVAVPALSMLGGYIGERAGSNIRGVGESIKKVREESIDDVGADVTHETKRVSIEETESVPNFIEPSVVSNGTIEPTLTTNEPTLTTNEPAIRPTRVTKKEVAGQTKEKKLFGSETLGKWFSAKGTKTGETGIIVKETTTTGEDKTIKVFAERIAGGLIGGDQYNVRIMDGDKVEEIKVMPFQYDRLQSIAESGDEQALKQWVVRARETQKRLEDMRDPEIRRHRAKATESQSIEAARVSNEPTNESAIQPTNESTNESAIQPATVDSPVYKIDEDFNFMERMEPVKNQRVQTMDKLSKEISSMKEQEAKSIFLTNNNQVINNNSSGEPIPTMIKGSPRMDSPFTKYLNRTLVFE